jgi:hypothetical protein
MFWVLGSFYQVLSSILQLILYFFSNG